MDNQRLLKIVNTDDSGGEVTLFLQPEQSGLLPRPGQGESNIGRGSLPQPPIGQPQSSSSYQLQSQPVFGPYQPSSNIPNTQYQPREAQPRQQQFYDRLLQQRDGTNEGQGLNIQVTANQNKAVLSTATNVTNSSSTYVWSGKDSSSWTPKLGSSKWLQQDLTSIQQNSGLSDPHIDGTTSEELSEAINFTSDKKIKRSVPSIFPVKLSRVGNLSSQGMTESTMSTARLDNIVSDLVSPASVSSPVPINLSSVVSANVSDGQSGYRVVHDVKPVHMTSTGYNVNFMGTNSAPSPVYKSKLEKAVEQHQQQQSNNTIASNPGRSTSSIGGTLKKLLGGSISDIDPLKLLQSFDWKPNFEQLVDQNNQSQLAVQSDQHSQSQIGVQSQAGVQSQLAVQSGQINQHAQMSSGQQMRSIQQMTMYNDMKEESMQYGSNSEIANQLQTGFEIRQDIQPQMNLQTSQKNTLNTYLDLPGVPHGGRMDEGQMGGYHDMYTQQSTEMKKPGYFVPISGNQHDSRDASLTSHQLQINSYESNLPPKYSMSLDQNNQYSHYHEQHIQPQMNDYSEQMIQSYEDKPVNMNQLQMGSYHEQTNHPQIGNNKALNVESYLDKQVDMDLNNQGKFGNYHEHNNQPKLSISEGPAMQGQFDKSVQSNPIKRVGHRGGRTLQSKKDILLDKTQADRFTTMSTHSHTRTTTDTTILQQTLPNMDTLPDMSFNQASQQLQCEPRDNYDTVNPNNYQYMLKDSDFDKQGPIKDAGYQNTTQSSFDYTNTDLNEFPPAASITDSIKDQAVITPSMMDSSKDQEVITEKDYYSSSWGDKLLGEQWRLREEGYFCDAVFYCKDRALKFHRLVMSAVCPAFLYRDHSPNEETQLVLPVDLLYDNVYLFMKYIYTGHIRLTIDNVQQIYRMASLFDVGELNSCCYHFCKLSKMGHLIISSPYQESAKQIYQSQYPHTDTKPQIEHPANETSLEITDVGTIEQIADILTKKSNDQKMDTQTGDIDFDWLSFDPGESNIPIRKRGRTRHKLNINESTNLPVNDSVNESSHSSKSTEKQDGSKSYAADTVESQTPEKLTHDKHVNFETPHSIATSEDTKYKSEYVPVKEKTNPKEPDNVQDSYSENALTIHLEELPDPLATGKFDETELIKREKDAAKVKKISASREKPSRKAMVTRYRGKPKTMTVLEAALHKKAKYNMSPTTVINKKPSKDKSSSKKSPKQTKSSEDRGNDDAATDKLIDDVLESMNKHEYDEKPGSFDGASENTDKNLHVSPEKSSPHNIKGLPAKKRSSLSRDKNMTETETSADVTELADGDVEEILSDSSTPKKPRLRKSTLDQTQDLPLKDTVYIRPPKKRTKEIREMMKNETDVCSDVKQKNQQEYTGISDELKQKLSAGQLKSLAKAQLLAEFKQKKQKKSKLLQDVAILRVMYEVEQYGRSIDGEKQYRCCLCNSTFVFSKRAITHIVNTHDISLDDTADYIDVEHRKPQPKTCDICGYVTKEVNIYYIHFHKYFKHGVPLPKGWQPFKCDFCKKEFFTKFQLREHKLTHFEDNPFVCELCGNGFKSRTGLNSHMFHKHSSVRKHKCPDCSKSFKTRTQMKVHSRTHSGERPYACNVESCMYRSTTRGNMKLHLLNRHKHMTDQVETIMKGLKASRSEPVRTDKHTVKTDRQTVNTADMWNIEEESGGSESDLPENMDNFDNAAFETLVDVATEITSNNGNIVKSEANDQQMSSSSKNGAERNVPKEILVKIVDNNLLEYTVDGSQTTLNLKPEQKQVDLILKQNSKIQNNNHLPQHNSSLKHQLKQKIGVHNAHEQDSQRKQLPSLNINNQQLKTPEISKPIVSTPKEQGNLIVSKKVLQIDPHSKQQPRMLVRQAFQGHVEKPASTTDTQTGGKEILFRRVGGLLIHPQLTFNTTTNNLTSSTSRDLCTADRQPRLVPAQTKIIDNPVNSNIIKTEPSSQNVDAFQQKPSNCSFKQAAVTRFLLKSDDVLPQSQPQPVSTNNIRPSYAPPAYGIASRLVPVLLQPVMGNVKIGQGQALNQGQITGQGQASNQGQVTGQGQITGQGHQATQGQIMGQGQPSRQGQITGQGLVTFQGHKSNQGQITCQGLPSRQGQITGQGQITSQGHPSSQGQPSNQGQSTDQGRTSRQGEDVGTRPIEARSTTDELDSTEEQLYAGFYQENYQLDNH